MYPELKKGIMAKFDAFISGVILCRVLKVLQDDEGRIKVIIRLLENKGAYTKGEILIEDRRYVIPCGAIKRSRRNTSGFIILPYGHTLG